MTIGLDGATLTLTDLVRAAYGAPVAAAPAALDAMARTAEDATVIAARRPVYGRSTGVGANRTIGLDPSSPDTGIALLRSHAVSAGPLRVPERVRATMVVRTNQLLAAGSGASPVLVEGLLGLLADGVVPPVRELGSVGTGDLSALATIGLALAGRGVPIGAGEALPLLSSNAATLADGALAVDSLTRLATRALDVAAVTFTAVDGNAEAFAPAVERATPFPGAGHVARTMRSLVASAAVAPPARIQDPFALRTLPQVHGTLLDALARAGDTVSRLVNAASENPLFDDGTVAHHGGFYLAPLAAALDGARLALLAAARSSLARLALLCDPAMTTLPPFLADPARPGASGVLALEYVAGSALGDVQMFATPAATMTVSVSRGVEEDASEASLAGRAALVAVPPVRTIVAAELLAGLRALRMRGMPVPATWASLAADLDDQLADRDLTADLARVEDELGAADATGPTFS
ncbi:aromatic amino acid lyase [Jatrophihabitans sp. YIM 134969]